MHISNKPNLESCREIYLYLGYDLDIDEDVLRLVKNFTWVDKQRENYYKYKEFRKTIFITMFSVLLASLGTIITEWLIRIHG